MPADRLRLLDRFGDAMRLICAGLLLTLIPVAARAETLKAIRPGLMCVSAEALAALTRPDGSSRANEDAVHAAIKLRGRCFDLLPGDRVTVLKMRHNTSIVHFGGRFGGASGTYLIPNIDFAPVKGGLENNPIEPPARVAMSDLPPPPVAASNADAPAVPLAQPSPAAPSPVAGAPPPQAATPAPIPPAAPLIPPGPAEPQASIPAHQSANPTSTAATAPPGAPEQGQPAPNLASMPPPPARAAAPARTTPPPPLAPLPKEASSNAVRPMAGPRPPSATPAAQAPVAVASIPASPTAPPPASSFPNPASPSEQPSQGPDVAGIQIGMTKAEAVAKLGRNLIIQDRNLSDPDREVTVAVTNHGLLDGDGAYEAYLLEFVYGQLAYIHHVQIFAKGFEPLAQTVAAALTAKYGRANGGDPHDAEKSWSRGAGDQSIGLKEAKACLNTPEDRVPLRGLVSDGATTHYDVGVIPNGSTERLPHEDATRLCATVLTANAQRDPNNDSLVKRLDVILFDADAFFFLDSERQDAAQNKKAATDQAAQSNQMHL